MTEKSTYYLETLTPDQLGKLLLVEFLSRDLDHQYVKNIINVGCPVDVRDNWNRTLLHWRCKAGQIDLVEFLIDNGFDIHARDRHDVTPLHCAVDECRIDIVRLLISRGADVNAITIYGDTPLHYNVRSGNIDILKLLISSGILVNVVNGTGFTAMHLVISRPDMSEIMYVIEVLASNGADIDARDKYGRSVLHWATVLGKIEVVKFLISKGSDIYARDADGRTAWDLASEEIREAIPELKPHE